MSRQYFTDVAYISPGARAALQRAGKAIASVTGQRAMTCDALPARVDPEARLNKLEETQDRHERAIRMLDQQGAGAVSWNNKKNGTGYEEFEDSDPDMDFHPADEREKVTSKLDFQRRKNDGPNVRADGSASETDDADAEVPRRPSVASIQGANEAFWRRDKSSMAGNAEAEAMQTHTAEVRPAGTISVEARKSTTAQTLDPGWTGDRRMQRIMAAQDARTAATLRGINSKWQARR